VCVFVIDRERAGNMECSPQCPFNVGKTTKITVTFLSLTHQAREKEEKNIAKKYTDSVAGNLPTYPLK
jgi:hypothetical protein